MKISFNPRSSDLTYSLYHFNSPFLVRLYDIDDRLRDMVSWLTLMKSLEQLRYMKRGFYHLCYMLY
jgi:hypothetical protein